MNTKTRTNRPFRARNVDLAVAYTCFTATVAVVAAGIGLAAADRWLAAVLVLWLAPSLILVGARAAR